MYYNCPKLTTLPDSSLTHVCGTGESMLELAILMLTRGMTSRHQIEQSYRERVISREQNQQNHQIPQSSSVEPLRNNHNNKNQMERNLFIDIQFNDLINNPIEVLKTVYRGAGISIITPHQEAKSSREHEWEEGGDDDEMDERSRDGVTGGCTRATEMIWWDALRDMPRHR